MTIQAAALVCAVLAPSAYAADQLVPPPGASSHALTLHGLARASQWRHIGAPPTESGRRVRPDQWLEEKQAFIGAFDAIKESWTGAAVNRPEDLRFQVAEYEDAIRTVMQSGGYGNIALADSLRRLSTALLERYLIDHPDDFAIVGSLLEGRLHLLDSPAVGDMLTEELKLSPRSGSWRLWDDPQDLDFAFRAAGSSLRDEWGRGLVRRPGLPAKLIAGRDIPALLLQLVQNEIVDRLILPATVEFLRLGGSLDNLASFDQVMKDYKNDLKLPGGGTIDRGNIEALVRTVREWKGKALPFTIIVGN